MAKKIFIALLKTLMIFLIIGIFLYAFGLIIDLLGEDYVFLAMIIIIFGISIFTIFYQGELNG